MEILNSLGVNWTIGIQLLCFLVSYFAFTTLVLKPYTAALTEREKRTIGNEQTAVRLIDQAGDLHTEYEKKARAISSQIKAQYDEARTQALRTYESSVEAARSEAARLLDQAREEITREVQSARQQLSAEVPAVSAAIASKLSGKEMYV